VRHSAKYKFYTLKFSFCCWLQKGPRYSCRVSKSDHIHLSSLKCEHHLNSTASLPPDSVMRRLPNTYIFSTDGSHHHQHNHTYYGAWECTFEVTAAVTKVAVIFIIRLRSGSDIFRSVSGNCFHLSTKDGMSSSETSVSLWRHIPKHSCLHKKVSM